MGIAICMKYKGIITTDHVKKYLGVARLFKGLKYRFPAFGYLGTVWVF